MTVSATISSNTASADMYHKAQLHISQTDAPTLKNTAGAVTYTAADVIGGLIVRDPNGASRTDVLPTAALLIAALVDERVGDTFIVRVMNAADANETITITAGSGGAFDTNITATAKIIAQDGKKEVIIRLTNVTAGSEAYVCYM